MQNFLGSISLALAEQSNKIMRKDTETFVDFDLLNICLKLWVSAASLSDLKFSCDLEQPRVLGVWPIAC